jgi:hypothetical protein
VPSYGVPTFYTCEEYVPRRIALIQGAILRVATFLTVCWAISYGGWHPVWLIGSHGRSHAGFLEAKDRAANVSLTGLQSEHGMAKLQDPTAPNQDLDEVKIRIHYCDATVLPARRSGSGRTERGRNAPSMPWTWLYGSSAHSHD